jgi:hypothetical protein
MVIKRFINTHLLLSIREREVKIINLHKSTDEVFRNINGHLFNMHN